MATPDKSRCMEFLLPDEQVLDCLKFRAYYRSSEFLLTDQRLLMAGPTAALGPSFTLLRGSMVAGFPLEYYESFIVGTGKRTMLLFVFLVFAVAGATMAAFPAARYPFAIIAFAAALISLAGWLFWPRTFITVCGKGLKVSGRVRLCEAMVFLEKLQLAAKKAKSGAPPAEVKETVATVAAVAEPRCDEGMEGRPEKNGHKQAHKDTH